MIPEFELPELPSVLTEHAKMVPTDVISELVAYVNNLRNTVNFLQSTVDRLERELGDLTNSVKTIAEILEESLNE